MTNRERVVISRGSVEIFKPLEISGIAKMMRSKFDVERGKDAFYYNVILLDSGGRGVINASPAQLDPADPQRFTAMLDRYREIKRRIERNAET